MKHYLYNQQFGRLTVTAYAGAGHWFCRCECGSAAVVSSNHLMDKRVTSCGCLEKEQMCTTAQAKRACGPFAHKRERR